MPSIVDNEIRQLILKTLFDFEQKNPRSTGGFGRERMKELLQLPEEKMDFNMYYLEQKGFVKLFKGIGIWFHARITAFGVDVIENKHKFGEQFPFIKTTIQEIHGDVHGNVVQAVDSKVSFNQQVTAAFRRARNMIETKDGISPTLKEAINEKVTLLEKELRSKKPDTSRTRKLWKWLKRNANWVVPTLAQVVLEVLK
ncbi:MAG: hypothetical protein JSV12_02285 [Candidatus Bathyarchaeota archaeon]|nr:MAG: hypothetical protein JSV12_02285 [Candidatus Bathyarchaeota archaeon]